MEAALLTVGDELLTGETPNTNATWLCQELTARGVRVRRIVVVPDRIEAIAAELTRLRDAFDRILVTGGVGPTHDDVTLDAVAAAMGRPMAENERARRWLREEGGYSAEELIEGTSVLPEGADPLHNEVGVAPGAKLDEVYVLPGVPEEMRGMFESIADDFTGEILHREEVVIDEPESSLLGRIAELREQFDVTVGSYPGEHVVVRITGAEERTVREAARWLADRTATVSPEESPEPGHRDAQTKQ